MTREYDEALDVTAGELRDRGVPIPESIPDCAWTPRDSLQPVVVEDLDRTPEDSASRNVRRVRLELKFEQPFRWLHVSGTVTT